jgi:enterochelin esterase-like enzyme
MHRLENCRFLDTVTAWATVAQAPHREEFRQALILDPQPQQSSPGATSPAENPTPHPRLRLHPAFESRYLSDARDLIVYLPPGYHQHPERTYPVLYLHDGQNLFDGRTSFIPGRTWQVCEQADDAIEAGEVEPLIIVGIYNTGDRRLAEYTPDRDWQMGGGEAASYGLLLTQELMPWVAGQYRVRPEREATGLGGSSLGGLVTLYLGLRYAERFGRLAVLSPSVWWNHKSILGYLNERAPQISEKPRLWLDVGDREGRRTLDNVEQLNRRLIANGWKPGETLRYERIAGGTHDEASWATRVRPMLEFLFPAPPENGAG